MADVVLVASGGGHLEQLKMLADRLPFDGEQRWLTFDTPQSRSLLEGCDVRYVPYVGPRDYVGLARNALAAHNVGSRRKTEAVVSTGAGIALAYLPAAAAQRIPTYYIESATRVVGPSFNGSGVIASPRRTALHSASEMGQSTMGLRRLCLRRLRDGTSRGDRQHPTGSRKPRNYPRLQLRRLVERLIPLFGESTHVVWQTGDTDVGDLPINARREVPHSELMDEIAAADLVVGHAGTGLALTCFNAKKSPVLVPREAHHGEHVDDHQAQTARLLARAGLATVRRVEELTVDDLHTAASRAVVLRRDVDRLPLELHGPLRSSAKADTTEEWKILEGELRPTSA